MLIYRANLTEAQLGNGVGHLVNVDFRNFGKDEKKTFFSIKRCFFRENNDGSMFPGLIYLTFHNKMDEKDF